MSDDVLNVPTFWNAVDVPKDGALLDRAELLEHAPNVVLGVLFRHHPDEEFPLWKEHLKRHFFKDLEIGFDWF